jgi:hypothetical protein
MYLPFPRSRQELSCLCQTWSACYTFGMAKRIYLSNVSALWPFPTQEVTLAALPGWPKGYVVFRDELDVRERRLRSASALPRRGEMLRSNTRKGATEAIYVASLAVFAVSVEDMIEALALAGRRGATVHFLAEGLMVPPASGAETLHRIAVAFGQLKRESRAQSAGQVSGAKKSAEARAKCETIRAEWPLPSADYPTRVLLDRVGISLNTAKLYLGARPTVQREHQIEVRRAAVTRQRKVKREEAQGE